MAKKAKCTEDMGGRVARVSLSASVGNIVDREMLSTLRIICKELMRREDLRVIVLSAEGQDFSFGASIQEHLPDQIANEDQQSSLFG